MPEDSLIEEMRAAVRGDRERARQRQLASRSEEPEPSYALGPPEAAQPEPAPEASPTEPAHGRRWLRLRRRSRR